jgi:hypothetical protein
MGNGASSRQGPADLIAKLEAAKQRARDRQQFGRHSIPVQPLASLPSPPEVPPPPQSPKESFKQELTGLFNEKWLVDTLYQFHEGTFSCMAVSEERMVFLHSDGLLYSCFIKNDGFGPLPDISLSSVSPLNSLLTEKGIKSISIHSNIILILTSQGRAYFAFIFRTSSMTRLDILNPITDIVLGNNYSLVLDKEGIAYYVKEQVSFKVQPLLSPRGLPIISISTYPCSLQTSLLLAKDGTVFIIKPHHSWEAPLLCLFKPLKGKDIVTISKGYRHNLALSREGKVYCWADENPEAIHLVKSLTEKNIMTLAASEEYGVVLNKEGRAYFLSFHNLSLVTPIGHREGLRIMEFASRGQIILLRYNNGDLLLAQITQSYRNEALNQKDFSIKFTFVTNLQTCMHSRTQSLASPGNFLCLDCGKGVSP